MTRCLITGATGFLGRYLVEALLKKGYELTLLVRDPDRFSASKRMKRWSEIGILDSIKLIKYNLISANLDLPDDVCLGGYDHVFHLAAVYDLASSKSEMLEANVEGTSRLLSRLKCNGFKGAFHFISSIAVAGDYEGVFDESMFDVGQKHRHAYHLSKFLSEQRVREFVSSAGFSIRIYRPSAVIGHSKTGQIDKLDGPYYLFEVFSRIKQWLPSALPMALPKTSAKLDLVPVDFVIDGLLALSELPVNDAANDLLCFHLTDPTSPSLTGLLKAVLEEADGVKPGLLIPIDFLSSLGLGKQIGFLSNLQALQVVKKESLRALGVPDTAFEALMPNLIFESAKTLEQLKELGVNAPQFRDYIRPIWAYYTANLDPIRNRERLAIKAFKNKRVIITGGSSGIGYESARLAYSYGAYVILVARDEAKLKACEAEIKSDFGNSGTIETITCDISELEACDAFVKEILARYGTIDILFSNAGRSIRRSIAQSEGRFHDLERTMQLNYFGAARLILGILPSMVKAGAGQIVHSSSMGTLSATPRFGPYMASKIALDTLMDSMAAEFANQNVIFSSIKFPLVQTPMVAPTAEFKQSKLTSPKQAANMFVDTIIDRSRIKVPFTGKLLSFASFVSPNFITQLYNYGFKVWPDHPQDYPEMGLDRAIMKYFLPHSPL